MQWSLLLAVAAMAVYLIQRHTGLPKVLGLISCWVRPPGWPASSGAVWPLQGIGLFLLELGIALVLFECGGRISLRWFRQPHGVGAKHCRVGPDVLCRVWVLLWLDQPTQVAGPLALVALAASARRADAWWPTPGPPGRRRSARYWPRCPRCTRLTLGSAWPGR